MKKFSSAAADLISLEESARGNSYVHKFNCGAKMAVTMFYIICVVSVGRYDAAPLIRLFSYFFILVPLSELNLKKLLSRLLIAMPFALFAGITNLFFDRETAFVFSGISVTFGAVSFFVIMLKTAMCVAAALLLIGTTRLEHMCNTLVKLKFNKIFVMQLLMIYRYLSVIISEFSVMSAAYSLRARNSGRMAIKFKDMGFFIGQYLLRVGDRAQRIFMAMKCRGFNGEFKIANNKKITFTQIIITITTCVIILGLRFGGMIF